MEMTMDFSLSVKQADEIFLSKLFERVQNLNVDEEWRDKGEQKKKDLERRVGHIEKGIMEAELKMQRITDLLTDINNPVPESMRSDLLQTYRGLEAKKEDLAVEKLTSLEDESDDEIIYEARSIIPDIINEWPNLPFVKRMKFVGALIHRVVFHRAAPSWIEMRIEWKEDITGWNFVDVAYIRITAGGGKSWSEEENIILSEMYPESTLQQMHKALPSRSWSSIQSRASAIGLHRKQGAEPLRPKNIYERSLSLQDYEYMQEIGVANDIVLYWSFL